jgi:GR25 family glycosyltransferase involved in LPS biosynthesis
MLKTYIIHLARSTDRKPIIQALEKSLPNIQIVDAVDGSALSETERLDFLASKPVKPVYPFELLVSEIGCFMSHRRAWKQIADGEEPFGFVVEDDLAINNGFEQGMALAFANANEDTLIRFPMHKREEPDTTIAQDGETVLFRPKVIGVTASLYLLGRDAARKLLEASQQIDRPVDTWLQMRWATGVDSLTLWPTHIHSAAETHGGSTIQAKKSAWAEISRGYKRHKYRSAIARRSAQSNVTT